MVVPSARGSPALVLSATPLAIAAASFIFASGTIMREGALHDWPELLNICAVPPVTALVKSASSRMMFGDLPPSSWLTRFTVAAARRATSVPARVEPVNEIMSRSGCSLIATPTSGPRPLTRLKTPLGTPASCMISAKIKAEVGVNSDGFRSMVQPAASAGATLQAIWFSGQFHGVIMPMTPIGSRTSTAEPNGSSNWKFLSTSRVVARWPRPAPACSFSAIGSGAPISSDTAAPISFIRVL